jgi:phosphatidate cytidylyltransferase
MLRTRVRSAILFGPIAILIVAPGGWWTLAVMFFVACLAAFEFARLMIRGEHRPTLAFIIAVEAVFFLDAAWPDGQILRPLLLAVMVVTLSIQLFRKDLVQPTVDWALSLAGGLYFGWLLAHFVYLRRLPAGLAWILAALLVTWACDSGAYFVGRAVGRHKLCPRLSPGKTWEGIAGGLLGALAAGALVGWLGMRFLGGVGLVPGLMLGLVVSVVSPFGDLVISMMKREVGAKDSGTLIPGHGGILDRTDSLLFVVTAAYYLAIWLQNGVLAGRHW